ncbi:Autophagy-related protein 101-like [Homarus americanus]|uniref:Autophagy-related protein 101 n=1 Tax=Homarus americanus TaxID=6706 RepID=A0A8J5JJL5_HOMAM|nr:Autophagy-related protein 101-like [Homarus americanus]
MNANTQVLELDVEGRQVDEAVLSLFHTLLFHRTTGKFHYKNDDTYAVGTIGFQDVDCDFIDFTYVRCSSEELDKSIRRDVSSFCEAIRAPDAPPSGQVALEFYQRKRGRWPFATESIPWEVWTLRVNVVSLNNEHGKEAVNFFVKAWGNTTKATVRHAWSALLPQLKSAETKRQQPAELMNQVLETICSIPAPGFQEVTREDLEEMMQEGNTNDVEDLLEDEEGGESGDAASDAGETEQRKVTTQKLSLLLGVFTSLQEMIQDIESESGEREHVIGIIESISRKYQTQYNERVNARQQSLITRFLSQRRPAEEDQQREIEVDEDIDDIGEMPEDFDFAGFDEMLAERQIWREKVGESLGERLLHITDTLNRHDYIPSPPNQAEIDLIYDTTYSDVQPFLFKVNYSVSAPSNPSATTTFKKLIRDTLAL